MLKLKQHVIRVYQVTENSLPESVDEIKRKIGTGPAYPYPVASTERELFVLGWAARAIVAGVFDSAWEALEPLIRRKLALTPYTRQAGD